MKTTNETLEAVKAMKFQHKSNWLGWYAKMKILAKNNGGLEADLSDLTVEEIRASGFTAAEAEALVFVMTQECMGQSCTSVEMIQRWFSYEA